MRYATIALIVLASLPRLPAAEPAREREVSLSTLLDEMVDRDELARLPDPWYECRQASSYDRDTTERDGPGWFANWDRSQFVRVDEADGRKEHVLMDVDGPGAVVRFWGTWHGPKGGPFTNGTLRIYLDGSATPAVEGPTADVISGGAIVGPPLSASVAPTSPYGQRGHNLYLPIPYARGCKITYETSAAMDRGAKEGEALYYQINYRAYEAGTRVRSFGMDQVDGLRSKIAEVQHRLLASGADGPIGPESRELEGEIPAGGSRTASLTGPGAVRELTIRLDAADIEQALRSTVLEIAFDGERTVWSPVGDFFGVGYRRNPYLTWTTRATVDGSLSCFWVMPFSRTCDVTLRNLGAQPVRAPVARIRGGAWTWDDRSLHFAATWRQYSRIPTGPNKDMTGKGAFDVNYVEVRGTGRYVGDTLTLFNGADAWWGEGDEKIYVDGERFPSHIGTGSEDYYGYAWCKPDYFTMPFHAQPDGSGNLKAGFSVNSRYRSLDAIPFRKSIRMDLELWHWRKTFMNYAPGTFTYARPGAARNVEPDPAAAALPVARAVADVVPIVVVRGAIEGEALEVAKVSQGKAEAQESGEFGWSGGKQLWWTGGKPGSTLVVRFPVREDGARKVKASLTKAPDYGIVRLRINGRGIEKEQDRYHPSVENDVIELGSFDLKAGANTLEVEIVGKRDAAVPAYMFGIDYLLLE